MNRLGLYLKISLLVVALVLVFFGMRHLSTDKVQSAFEALGIEPGAPGKVGFQPGGEALETGEARRTLCHTRIRAIHFSDGRSVVEHKVGLKLDWTAEEAPSAENKGSSRSLGYLEIEKWFSLHCQFSATPEGLKDSQESLEPSNEPVKLVRLEFIDGTVEEIYRSGEVLFSQNAPNDRFRSPDLEGALQELRAIAGFPVDSKDR